MNHDEMLEETPGQAQYQASFRRRPIVVRDPKTGETRLVGTRGRSTVIAPPYRYRGGYEEAYEKAQEELGFDDEGRAPIMKIVSGYRGRQIVVRDPSRRPGASSQPPLGVRGGVKKAPYYERRPAKSSPSPYSDEFEDEQHDRQPFYDDDEEPERMFQRDRDSDYDRDVDHRMHSGYDDSRYEKQYYKNEREIQEEDDLTGKVVYVDNLSNDVTTRGLADLFGMVGQVKELRLLYDRQGNPNGSADIVFQRRVDAEEAIRSLHNVPLNNRPMRLSMGNSL